MSEPMQLRVDGELVADVERARMRDLDGAAEVEGTADHAYLPDKKLLILPRMLENKVTAYDLSGLLP